MVMDELLLPILRMITLTFTASLYSLHLLLPSPYIKEEEAKGDSLSLSLPCKTSSITYAVSVSSKQVDTTDIIAAASLINHITWFRSRRGRDSASPSRRKQRSPSDESIEEGELSEDELERKRMQVV